MASPASAAADFEVNSPADAPADSCDPLPAGCTLRDAVNAANTTAGPDTITFASALSGSVITLTQGQIAISSGDNSATTVNGGGTISVSGDANGDSIPNMGDSRIFVASAGPTTISGLTLTGGFTASAGGAIASYGPDLAIAGSTISGSAAASGGAISASGPLDVENSTISGNNANGPGGAIAPSKYDEATVTGSTISGNTATGPGGAIATGGKYGSMTVTDSTIANNTSNATGGAISAGGKYAPMQISGTTISGNSAPSGGGVSFGNVVCAPFPGPPFFVYCDNAGPSDSAIVDSTISGNHATGAGLDGGGLALGQLIEGDNFTISRSTISGNDATSTTSYGGGVATSSPVDGTFQIVDSTVSGNDAGAGGGVSVKSAVGSSGSISADNTTIAGNTATYDGGGMWAYISGTSPGPYTSPPVGLNSTIVGDNTAGVSPGPNDLGRELPTTTGATVSGGFQLSFSLVEAPTDAIDTQANSIIGVDPQLAGLANNGGPTFTLLPAATSPAIDTGSNPLSLPTDQRGQPRTIDRSTSNASDGTDIGAVEISQNPPAPAPPAKKKPKCKKKHKKKHKRSADSAKKKHKKCKKKKKKKRH